MEIGIRVLQMNQRKKLSIHSRNLFFSGLVFSRLSNIGIPLISFTSFLLSSILYLGGYVTWLLSVNYTRLAGLDIAAPWRQQYQQQNQQLPQYLAASIIGVVASIALITSFWLPITFGLISSWLFLSSNTFWWWAEQINITNSRQRDLNANLLSQRENYFTYTTFATLNSLLIAINITMHWILPASVILPVGIMLSFFLAALTIHTFHYWVKNVVLTLSLAEEELEIDAIEESLTYSKLQQRVDFSPISKLEEIKKADVNVQQSHHSHHSQVKHVEAHDVGSIRSNTP